MNFDITPYLHLLEVPEAKRWSTFIRQLVQQENLMDNHPFDSEHEEAIRDEDGAPYARYESEFLTKGVLPTDRIQISGTVTVTSRFSSRDGVCTLPQMCRAIDEIHEYKFTG